MREDGHHAEEECLSLWACRELVTTCRLAVRICTRREGRASLDFLLQ